MSVMILVSCCRFSTGGDEYKEDLEVIVGINLKSGEKKCEFYSKIESKKRYNSWFYVDFGKKVFVPKGTKCVVEVRSTKNIYQLIPFAHIRENIEKAEKCEAFSQFEILLLEQEQLDNNTNGVRKSLEVDGKQLFCMKSLSVVPVDEQGYLDNMG